MKEARIDDTLEVIGNQKLVFLPPTAVKIDELWNKNVEHGRQMAKDLQTRSQAAEEATIELIDKFVKTVDDPNIDNEEKFHWLDVHNLLKGGGVIKPHNLDDEGKYFILHNCTTF